MILVDIQRWELSFLFFAKSWFMTCESTVLLYFECCTDHYIV